MYFHAADKGEEGLMIYVLLTATNVASLLSCYLFCLSIITSN